MELLQSPSLQALLIFSLFLIALLKIAKRGKTKDSTSNLPPGPWTLPFIGNLHQLVDCLPHHGLRDLAEIYGPLMYLRLGEVPTLVVSSAECAKEVMKTHDAIFATRPHTLATRILTYRGTNIGFSPYGEYWRELRKICMLELLSTKRVQSFRRIREEEVLKLIKWIASRPGSPINLTEEIYSCTYCITSRAAFGKKSKDHEKAIYIGKEAAKVTGGFALADFFPSVNLLHVISGMRTKLEKLHNEADMIMEDIIKEHKEGKTTTKSQGEGKAEEDLVDVLLKYHDHSCLKFSLTVENIKAVIQDIFGAGSETSSTVVDWVMAEMIKNPRTMKMAQDREVFNRKGHVDETGIKDMKYLNLVIKETLRLHPSAPLLLPRECRETCEIAGYKIPVKTKVVINAWAIGRDPKFWTEPEIFYPERFVDSSIDYKGTNFEYIPFGAGRRICPGISYGLANVELPVALLLYYFDWKLPNEMKNEDLDMTEAFGVTVRRKEDLHLIPTPCYPPPTTRVYEC
ncbi:cytochrome P450 71D11-like [Rosa rugosa]|uniref:cytochrome P450 71D11-like n=1 Tax=Rosa rugosa TaxID=74645 RepID=UPI002B404FD8|nr:cytochrome P450 71D11-like [Rosa rugosa]